LTPEFQKAYLELLGKTNFDPVLRRVADGSIAALIRDYCGCDEFLNLKPKTQRDYGRMLDFFAPSNSIPPMPCAGATSANSGRSSLGKGARSSFSARSPLCMHS